MRLSSNLTRKSLNTLPNDITAGIGNRFKYTEVTSHTSQRTSVIKYTLVSYKISRHSSNKVQVQITSLTIIQGSSTLTSSSTDTSKVFTQSRALITEKP